ncbi:MAG: 16S rRNA (cytosine(1402)-N(4))-methyltransferase, partial [Ilumatobacteraceae bacterium]
MSRAERSTKPQSPCTDFQHQPVMVGEITDAFATVPAGFVLDATLGGGGHAESLLEAHDHVSILGIDRDVAALAAAGARLDRFGDRVRTVHCRFDHLDHAMISADVMTLSGAL